jgi:hypothetical protein
MSNRDELKELVDKYHDAISCTDFCGECSLSESSIDPLEEEYKIRKQLFDKIDEVVDINDPKWIPIEQQKPSEFELVLCCILGEKENAIEILYRHGDSYYSDYDSGIVYSQNEISHWMPLPDLPKGE